MSLAVLARKTKTKQRLRSSTCGNRRNYGGRAVGFVLNMTGRGGGIGLSGMSYKQRGQIKCTGTQTCACVGCCEVSCKTGQAETCCHADHIVSKECRDNCNLCWYGGLSQPAPQMSYRIYINRKANGAFRPGGRKCCKPDCTTANDPTCGTAEPNVNRDKNPNTWKQPPNIAASTITEHRRQAAIRCASGLVKTKSTYLGGRLISCRPDAKPVCSWYNPVTAQYETVTGPNPLTENCQCSTSLPIKGRLAYPRINKNWCNTTKTLVVGTSSSEQIAKRKQSAFQCNCPPACTPFVCPDDLTVVVRLKAPPAVVSGPTSFVAGCTYTFIPLNPPFAADSVINGVNVSGLTSASVPIGQDQCGEQLIAWESHHTLRGPLGPITCTESSEAGCVCTEERRRQSNRYCYPRPLATGSCRGYRPLTTPNSRAACARGCPQFWNSS